jgi:hypothetical protein
METFDSFLVKCRSTVSLANIENFSSDGGGLEGVRAGNRECGRGLNNIFHEFTIRRRGFTTPVASSPQRQRLVAEGSDRFTALPLSIPIVRWGRIIFGKGGSMSVVSRAGEAPRSWLAGHTA